MQLAALPVGLKDRYGLKIKPGHAELIKRNLG